MKILAQAEDGRQARWPLVENNCSERLLIVVLQPLCSLEN